MSILSSTNSGQKGIKEQIERWLSKWKISKYKLKPMDSYPFFIIDVRDANVLLSGYPEEALPDYIVFNEIIGGSFVASFSSFTTMKGFPRKVGKNFDISFSNIASMDDAPELVNMQFSACGLHFTKEQIREKTKVTCKVFC